MTTPRGPISAEQAHAEVTSLLRELIAVVKGVTAEVRGLRDDIAKRPAKGPSAPAASSGSAPAGPPQVSERDVDEFAGKSVKKMPSSWKGQDFTGYHHDETSPDFLECLAGLLEWKATKPLPGKEQYVKFDRRDATCARMLAQRLRERPPDAGAMNGAGSAPPREDSFEL